MFYPSGVNLPEGQEYIVEKSGNGLYTVQNAYEGDFAYFKDRPIAEIKTNQRRVQTDETYLADQNDVSQQ